MQFNYRFVRFNEYFLTNLFWKFQASQYLQNNLAGQTEQDVKNMMTALLHFPVPLTHDEKLMIVNTLPRTPLELSVVILLIVSQLEFFVFLTREVIILKLHL